MKDRVMWILTLVVVGTAIALADDAGPNGFTLSLAATSVIIVTYLLVTVVRRRR